MSRVTHIQRIVLATMVAALIGGATPAAEPVSVRPHPATSPI